MNRQPVNVAKLTRQLATLTDRINALCLEQQAHAQPKLGVTIAEAAGMLGMSAGHFRRVFLESRRVRSIPMGDRARVIDVAELRDAYERYKHEIRAASDAPACT